MAKITPGSTIIGASGKKLVVEAIEGDIIYSGELRILRSAVVKVIPPQPNTLRVGDRVKRIGNSPDILEIWLWNKTRGSCMCIQPDGYPTDWIPTKELIAIDS